MGWYGRTEDEIKDINKDLKKYKKGTLGWIKAAESWNDLVNRSHVDSWNLNEFDCVLKSLKTKDSDGDVTVHYIAIPEYSLDLNTVVFEDDGKGIEAEEY
jgi:hypothetical protein